MPIALVTGANRGLGLEHCRAFAARDWQVIACARQTDAPELAALAADAPGRVRVVALDVTDHDAVAALAAGLRGTAIDVLVNNAGTAGPGGGGLSAVRQGLHGMDYGLWREILEVNLLGAFSVATALRDHVAASGTRLIVNMSSDLGSIAQNRRGNVYAYRTSKAGLNMVTRGMAVEWRDLVVIAMAPGWCRTELGGADAEIDPADSVREQQTLFGRLGPQDSGRFLDRFGNDVPW
jgi:NAD(P)-dependent dehydrogenase (short-subunit alcohol dehydrogenase family)